MAKKETYSYKGWLNSDSFFKRAFAIFGYSLIPAILIWMVLIFIAVFLIVITTP